MASIPVTSFAEILRWLLRRRVRYRVTGSSMYPLLRPGDEVLADPNAFQSQLPAPDDIVVALHPRKTGFKIIKRVTSVQEIGSVELRGDNPEESTDFQTIPLDALLGRVTSKFP